MSHSSRFSRRHLIQGLGVAGLFSCFQVERLLAQSQEAPLRVLFVPLQHGWGISRKSNQDVTGSLRDFTFPSGLAPLNAVKDEAVVIDSLLTLGQWGNNHDLSYADILTAGVPFGEEGSDFDSHMPLSQTPSIDYLLEEHHQKQSFRFCARFRSWGVAYHPLSFDRSSTVLPYYTDARAAYESIFADLPEDDGEATAAELEEEKLVSNVLSYIKKPAERQRQVITSDEQLKLERYLQAVEAMEAKNGQGLTYAGTERLASIPEEGQSAFDDLDDYLEMVRVGFANDLTRSAVVGIGDIHPINQFHHDHAHNNTNTWWDTRVDFAQTIADFVGQLADVEDFDGRRLLDNTIIVLTGEVGDGTHDVLNKGHILLGGSAHIDVGRFIEVPRVPDHNTLMRENKDGVLQKQVNWGADEGVPNRSSADLLRELGNLSGLSLNEFGLPSQNKGSLL